MKWLSNDLKRALNALAAADAGEMLTRRGKQRHLSTPHPTATQHPPKVEATRQRRQVALWTSRVLSDNVFDYALATCHRLDMDLLLFHPDTLRKHLLSEQQASKLAHNGIHVEYQAVRDTSSKTLTQHLSGHTRIAFLVMDGDDALLHDLTHKLAHMRRGARLPVPLVVVSEPEQGQPAMPAVQAKTA